jgi:phage FluMu protein Com
MRELIIRAWCDRCESLGNERTPAEHTYTIGIVKGETRPAPRVIELCDECDAAIDWLPKLMADFSIPLDPKAPIAKPTTQPAASVPTDRVVCKVCGSEIGKSAIVSHVWAKHKPGQSKPEHPNKCPDCGMVNATGMGQHRSQAHGWSPLADAYRGLV